MATYLLEGASTAGLPRQPLAVSLSVEGDPAGARLVARLERTGAEAPTVRQHSAGLLIVPRIEETIVVAAVPDGGRERFDAKATLHVSISLDSARDSDSDVVQLAPRDVSGLTSIELVTLAPSGADQILVTTRLIQHDVALSRLAARARVACRGALGLDQLPISQQRPLGCVIDLSTSMAPLAGEGFLSAALEIVVGIAAVVAGQAPVKAMMAAQQPSAVSEGPGAELSKRVRDTIDVLGYGLASDLQAAVTELGGDVGLIILITDAPGPATVVQTEAVATCLVLSGSSTAACYPSFRGAVCAPVPPGKSAVDHLVDNPHLVDQIVADLVSPLAGSVG